MIGRIEIACVEAEWRSSPWYDLIRSIRSDLPSCKVRDSSGDDMVGWIRKLYSLVSSLYCCSSSNSKSSRCDVVIDRLRPTRYADADECSTTSNALLSTVAVDLRPKSH